MKEEELISSNKFSFLSGAIQDFSMHFQITQMPVVA